MGATDEGKRGDEFDHTESCRLQQRVKRQKTGRRKSMNRAEKGELSGLVKTGTECIADLAAHAVPSVFGKSARFTIL